MYVDRRCSRALKVRWMDGSAYVMQMTHAYQWSLMMRDEWEGGRSHCGERCSLINLWAVGGMCFPAWPRCNISIGRKRPAPCSRAAGRMEMGSWVLAIVWDSAGPRGYRRIAECARLRSLPCVDVVTISREFGVGCATLCVAQR